MDIQITVTGLSALEAKVGRLATLNNLRPAMRDSLNRIWDSIAKYPPPPARGSFRGFRSEKQRRWFFAALRSGVIRVPYVRTGTLGRSWTQRIDVSVSGMVGRVGTNVVYAPWVQDRDRQAEIHQGRWQTAQDVADKLRSWIVNRFDREVRRLLRQL